MAGIDDFLTIQRGKDPLILWINVLEKKQNLAGNDWTFYRPEDIIITYVENYLYPFGYTGKQPFLDRLSGR
jgi:hypothetical protein